MTDINRLIATVKWAEEQARKCKSWNPEWGWLGTANALGEAAAQLRADHPEGGARTPQDYAIEFGEYLAQRAVAFLRLMEEPDQGADKPDMCGEVYGALRNAICEFRKRADRCAPTVPIAPGPAAVDGAQKSPFTPPSKEWCERMAQLEDDSEIGAGGLAAIPPIIPAKPTLAARAEAVERAIRTRTVAEVGMDAAALSAAAHTLRAMPGMVEALKDAVAHLAGATSAYKTYAGNSKREGVRDALYSTLLKDFEKATERGRAALRALEEGR